MKGRFTWAEILEGKHLIGLTTPTRQEPMTLQEYQELAGRTLQKHRRPTDAAANMAMGLAGESGELVDLMKKVLFHGHPFELETMTLELGDVLWYLAGLCTVHGMSLEDVARRNVEKLKARYPEGFTQKDSLSRDN